MGNCTSLLRTDDHDFRVNIQWVDTDRKQSPFNPYGTRQVYLEKVLYWRSMEPTGQSDAMAKSVMYRDVSIIILLGILSRAVLLFFFDFYHDLRGGDSLYYLEVGRNIIERGVHADANGLMHYRAPLYSLFAGLIASGAESAMLFYTVQSTLFIGFSIVVYAFLCRTGRRLAFISALLIVASPFDALFNGRVLSENLVTPLIVVATLAFAYARGLAGYVLSGLLLGLAALTREIFVLLPLCFVAIGILARTRGRNLAYLLLAFALVISPWIYRNSQLPTGGLFLSGGAFFYNIFIGTWERDANWTVTPKILPPEALETLAPGMPPADLHAAWVNRDQQFLKNVALNYMKNHPFRVIRAWISRYPRLWIGTRIEIFRIYAPRNNPLWFSIKASFFGLNAALLVLAALGAAVALRTRKLPVALLVPIIYTALILLPFHTSEPRYTQPVLPILEIYCAFLLIVAIDHATKLLRKTDVGAQ